MILISSTAMQIGAGSRLVPASGPLANLLFGILGYMAVRRISRVGPARLLLWLFAFANLFVGTGYILYSGLTNFGDSAFVIAGMKPAWVFRGILIVFGACGYRSSVQLAARDMLGLIRNGSVLADDVPRIVHPSWIAGSLLYFVASLFNPVSPSLILYDGFSESCGVAVGFLLLAKIVRSCTERDPSSFAADHSMAISIPFSATWVLFA